MGRDLSVNDDRQAGLDVIVSFALRPRVIDDADVMASVAQPLEAEIRPARAKRVNDEFVLLDRHQTAHEADDKIIEGAVEVVRAAPAFAALAVVVFAHQRGLAIGTLAHHAGELADEGAQYLRRDELLGVVADDIGYRFGEDAVSVGPGGPVPEALPALFLLAPVLRMGREGRAFA